MQISFTDEHYSHEGELSLISQRMPDMEIKVGGVIGRLPLTPNNFPDFFYFVNQLNLFYSDSGGYICFGGENKTKSITSQNIFDSFLKHAQGVAVKLKAYRKQMSVETFEEEQFYEIKNFMPETPINKLLESILKRNKLIQKQQAVRSQKEANQWEESLNAQSHLELLSIDEIQKKYVETYPDRKNSISHLSLFVMVVIDPSSGITANVNAITGGLYTTNILNKTLREEAKYEIGGKKSPFNSRILPLVVAKIIFDPNLPMGLDKENMTVNVYKPYTFSEDVDIKNISILQSDKNLIASFFAETNFEIAESLSKKLYSEMSNCSLDFEKYVTLSAFSWHMKHMTKNGKSIKYILAWIKNALNNRNETFLILRGGRGCGKGVFEKLVNNLFHPHSVYSENHVVTSMFNGHLQNRKMVIFDEFYNTIKGDSYLKRVAEETQSYHHKGKSIEGSSENHASFIFSCNVETEGKGNFYLSQDERRMSLPEIRKTAIEDEKDEEALKLKFGLCSFLYKRKESLKTILKYIQSVETLGVNPNAQFRDSTFYVTRWKSLPAEKRKTLQHIYLTPESNAENVNMESIKRFYITRISKDALDKSSIPPWEEIQIFLQSWKDQWGELITETNVLRAGFYKDGATSIFKLKSDI